MNPRTLQFVVMGAFIAVNIIIILATIFFVKWGKEKPKESFTRGPGESLLARMMGGGGSGANPPCNGGRTAILPDARPGEYNAFRTTWAERPSELAKIGERYRPSAAETAQLGA